MTLKSVYNIQTQQLEWFVNGEYLTATEVQPYFDKLYKIDHQVTGPTWGPMD